MRLLPQIFTLLLCAATLVSMAAAQPATPLTRAIALFEQREFAAAEKALRSIPGRPARLYEARLAVELGRYRDALRAIELALAGQPDAETRFRAGEILRDLGERRLAALDRTHPNHVAVLEMTGENLERSGRRREALQAYREAAGREPNRLGLHYRIGNVLWRERDLDGATTELTKELERNPGHGMANLRLGQVLLARNTAEPAIAPLERATTALPELTEARRELGKAYRKAERPQEARREWETVARQRPEDDQVHFLLGGLYRELGLTAEAKREFQRHASILAKRAAAAGGRAPAAPAAARPPGSTPR